MPHYKGWLPANEATRAHAVNEHGAWQMAGKFACRFKSAHWGLLCQAFSISSSIFALKPLLISILTLWLSISLSFSTLLSTKSSRCTCSISTNIRTLYCNNGRAHTSCTHFNWIFELMSSLRSNYALYRDTKFNVPDCVCPAVYIKLMKNPVTSSQNADTPRPVTPTHHHQHHHQSSFHN